MLRKDWNGLARTRGKSTVVTQDATSLNPLETGTGPDKLHLVVMKAIEGARKGSGGALPKELLSGGR